MFVGREEELSRLDGLWAKSAFKVPRTKSIRTVLVYEGELSKRVPTDAFFSFIISADRLLGRRDGSGEGPYADIKLPFFRRFAKSERNEDIK